MNNPEKRSMEDVAWELSRHLIPPLDQPCIRCGEPPGDFSAHFRLSATAKSLAAHRLMQSIPAELRSQPNTLCERCFATFREFLSGPDAVLPHKRATPDEIEAIVEGAAS
jgi:hypothetical protein